MSSNSSILRMPCASIPTRCWMSSCGEGDSVNFPRIRRWKSLALLAHNVAVRDSLPLNDRNHTWQVVYVLGAVFS